LTLELVDFDAIRAAQQRIRDWVNRTPVMTSRSLDAASGAQLFFKCENLQKCGAFKARGAANAVLSLRGEQARHGVATHSSGNHGAALARAAALRGIRAHIVMPRNSSTAKIDAVKRYGGEVTLCEPTLPERERSAAELVERTGAEFVHPYDDSRVIAGQGTAALELLEDIPELDVLICPVGGGGLLSGSAVAARSMRPSIRIIAAEPAEADDAWRSFRAQKLLPGTPTQTIADGLRSSMSALTFLHMRRLVDAVVTTRETSIVAAMRRIWEVMKLLVEPSAAVAYAPVYDGSLELRALKVGIILTGGNLDLDRLPWRSLNPSS
jgi:threonine dehydratase